MAGSVAAGTKLGRYEIVKHLTSGGMADLLLARASGLEGFERHVVIKRIRAEQENDQAFVEMFLHEARLAGSLHHHNIVQVYDIGEENGKPYFAMEYVHGEDLRTMLRRLHERKEQLPLQHLVTIMAAAATGLHHAHEQRGPDRAPLNIVHRDITPANILVGYDGNVKVVDFGIARATVKRAATQAGMLVGRAPYMAPEQCTGATIDRRCDIFALGVVMYELVTVRRLFKGDNEFLTMSSIVKGTIPKPSTLRKDLPPQLEELILRMLAREPAARYQNGAQVLTALEQLAVALNLRISATSLASYMKQLFGERPEPWLGAYTPPVTRVDFDEGPGVVATPSDAEASAIPKDLRTTKSAPIVRAAETATPTPVPATGSQATPRAVPATGSQATPAPTAGVSIPRTKTPVPSLAKLTPARPAPGAAPAPAPSARPTPIPSVRPTPNPVAKPAAQIPPVRPTPLPEKPTPSPISTEAPTQRAKPSDLDEDDATAVVPDEVVAAVLEEAPAKPPASTDDDLDNLSFEVSKPKVFEVAKPVVAAAVEPAPPVVTKGVSAVVRVAKPPVDDLPEDTIAQDEDLDLPTGITDDATALATPPPPAAAAKAPAPVPAGRRSDPTEVVTPLPAPVDVQADAKNKLGLLAGLSEDARPAPASNKKKLLIAGIGGLAVLGAVVAFVIGSSGGDATKSSTKVSANAGTVEKVVAPPPAPTPPPEPTPTPEPVAQPAAGSDSGSGSGSATEEPKPEEPKPEEPKPEEPKPEEPKPEEPKPEPATVPPTETPKAKPVPKAKPKTVAAKPKTKPKATPKPKAKPAKPAPAKPAPAKPGWDPNALFPKK